MSGKQELLQHIQQLFSKALGHPIMIAELQELTLSHNQDDSVGEKIKQHINPDLIAMNHPILFESHTGEKAIFCKIPRTDHFLYVHSIQQEDPKLMEDIRWISKGLSVVFVSLNQEQLFAQLKHNIELLCKDPSDWLVHLRQLYQLLHTLHPRLEFLGIAERTGDEEFIIRDCTDTAMGLQGKRFKLGQGYLGQTAITGSPGYWAPSDADPRIRFFEGEGVLPKSLFSCPIKQGEQGIQIILFGGSFQVPDLPELFKTMCELIAGVIGFAAAQAKLEQRILEREYFLKALYEINQTMVSLQDVKQILYILVDTSLNLLHRTTAIVGLFPEQQPDREQKLQFISRGMTPSEVKGFSTFFIQHMHGRHLREIALSVTPDGEKMLEIPLNYRNHCKGILFVAMPESELVSKEQLEFVNTLAIMSAAFIHMILEVRNPVFEDEVGILRKALKYWNPELYDKAMKAELVAVGFAKHLGLSEESIEHIQEACILSCYPIENLLHGQMVLGDAVKAIVQELRAKAAATTLLRLESKIIIMANLFAHHHGRLEELEDKIPFSDHRQSFIQFLAKRIMLDKEISLKQVTEPSFEDHATGLDLSNITNREKEVLRLIMEGLSNRDIAAALFISEHTVKNHISNLFHKLGVTDRTQLMTKIIKSKKELVLT